MFAVEGMAFVFDGYIAGGSEHGVYLGQYFLGLIYGYLLDSGLPVGTS